MDLNGLLKMKIVWQKLKPDGVDYTSKVNGDAVFLRMNDFPDEPIFTIFYKGKQLDIEERPQIWEFPWSNSRK